MTITERRMTLEEFLRLAEEEPPLEYWDGKVTRKVSPQGKHGRLETKFAERVNRFAEPPRLAMAITELRATFGGGSPVPDVAIYRWDRIPLDPDGAIADVFVEAPDIAVEILSPGRGGFETRPYEEQIEKCRWFVDHGVQIALLFHPRERSVRLFRPDAELRVLRGADRIDLDAVLPGFELTVNDLFAMLYPG